MSYTPATEELIRALQALPGVGTRSAQRMALQLLERDTDAATRLNGALASALQKVRKCPTCRTLTESELCGVCADEQRDATTLCVVANDADKAGIEMSGRYRGRYFVLHGVLSPIDGVGPEQLGVFDLLDLVKTQSVAEVILALDEQLEAEATVHYLTEHLKQQSVTISRLPFTHLKSGALDQADSRVIANALASKQEIGFELD